MDPTTSRTFSPWDYAVFVVVLVISASIGVFFGCTGGKNRTTSEFLLADRKMGWLPVTLSLLASFMSAITVLGLPSEAYTYGTMYMVTGIAQAISMPLCTYLYHPVFYRLKLTSVYEYLELRFHRSVRVASALIFILQMLSYMAIVLYAPSLALSAVTGLNIWIAVCSVGLVCTFYTSIGGIKAVMWTDVFQVIMIYAGLLAALIQGSIVHGGFSKIWQIAQEGNRIEFDNISLDPRIRHTWWGLIFGGLTTWLTIYGVNQAQVQRILSCPDIRTGRIAVLLNIIGLVSLVIITSLAGLACYATYVGCDPVRNGQIMANDQLLAKFVMDHLGHLPGVPGLFVACVFSAALSTLSSGMNSLAAVAMSDVGVFWCWKWSEKKVTIATKILALVFGLLTIALTVLPAYLGSVLTMALSLFGILGGPLLAIFSVGMFLPWINWKGGLAGLLTGLAMSLWVGVGAQIYRPWLNARLPVSTDLCPVPNTTAIPTTFLPTTPYPEDLTTGSTPLVERSYMMEFYAVSYQWYGPIGSFTVLVVAVIVSAVTGFVKPEKLDPLLISPMFDWMCCCLPESCRQKLWCGVRHDQAEYDEDDIDAAVRQVEFTDIVNVKPLPDKKLKRGGTNPAFKEESEGL